MVWGESCFNGMLTGIEGLVGGGRDGELGHVLFRLTTLIGGAPPDGPGGTFDLEFDGRP